MGNATTDTICTACPANTFKAAAGGGACATHTVCPAGEVPSAVGNATIDTICTACPANTVKLAEGLRQFIGFTDELEAAMRDAAGGEGHARAR